MLIWNNMNPDGTPNELTIHEGMPVVEGVKYIVTKWFREGRWIK
jgi:prolyl 4-hydroxylase